MVIPCRDEAPALPDLLARIPEGFHPIVVDNGSRDATAEVARGLGATVVVEPRPGTAPRSTPGSRPRPPTTSP